MKKRKKQALVITSVASMLDHFNQNNIALLQQLGYQITIAANFKTGEDISSPAKIRAFVKKMKAGGVRVVQIDFTRNPCSLWRQMNSFRQVRRLLGRGFDLVHCHAPICAAITRIVFQKYRKKCGAKLIYTAHGFHFFHGASIKSWLFYYPMEKLLSRWTDVLITINREDYARAKKKFQAEQTVYVPGIGIDLNRFCDSPAVIERKREELGLDRNMVMLLSVGELSIRKNHNVVFQALSRLDDPQIKYYICGIGRLEEQYKKMLDELGIRECVKFLGYRTDIPQLCQAADLFVFPSLQEGLPVALMEAIAAKTPVICSGIRGNRDLVKDQSCLFHPKDVKGLCACLEEKLQDGTREGLTGRMQDPVVQNYKQIANYRIEAVSKKMQRIYQGCDSSL